MSISCTIEKPSYTASAETQLSHQEWREIWLNRLLSQCEKDSIPEETVKQYQNTIQLFLEKNPKAPKYMSYNDFISYHIQSQRVIIFFKQVYE